MKLYNDYEYKADKGKYFVLTELGKTWASYKNNEVGKPITDLPQYGSKRMVDEGALIEVDDPDFVIMPGYRAVYNYKGYVFDVGNPIVYPLREQAEAAAREFDNRSWHKDGENAYVIEATYEGKRPRECREYNGKKVHNIDTWTCNYPVGTLAEEEVVDDMINCLPPACTRSDCSQLGEPKGTRIDDNGITRNTYITFKKIAEGIWEYCGDCFRGENVQRGTEPVYV